MSGLQALGNLACPPGQFMTGIGPGGITCAPVGGGGSQTLYFSGVRNNVAVAELASPLRPSVAIAGQRVNGPLSRATRPPS